MWTVERCYSIPFNGGQSTIDKQGIIVVVTVFGRSGSDITFDDYKGSGDVNVSELHSLKEVIHSVLQRHVRDIRTV